MRARSRERRDPEATRRALLQAGAALFAERGYDGVSTESIAARAGVNKALISYHFRGKRGLYAAILESSFRSMSERLHAIESKAPSATAALVAFVEAFRAVAAEEPGFPTLFLREVLTTGVEPAVVPHLVRIVGVSQRLVERGVREGVLRRVDPLLLHFGLVGSLVFFFATEPARRKAVAEGRLPFRMPDADAFVRYLQTLTLRGLAPDRRPSRARRSEASR